MESALITGAILEEVREGSWGARGIKASDPFIYGHADDFDEPRTKLADIFSILLGVT